MNRLLLLIASILLASACCTDAKEENPNTIELYVVDSQSNRTKRTLIGNEARRWDKGIVPYTFKDYEKISQAALDAIDYAMSVFEYHTCLRFVHWYKGINKDLGLDKSSYLVLTKSTGSYVGNLRHFDKGQTFGCHDGKSCIFQMSNSLGFLQEVQNPRRKGWIRVNFENINPKYSPHFYSLKESSIKNYAFDLQSYMTYGRYGFSTKAGTLEVISMLFPSLAFHQSLYYMLREVALSHKCSEHSECAHFTTKCENDGYVTVLAGRCSCRCPHGLNPDTGCTTILKAVPSHVTMPKGKYGLPMHKAGCPDASFLEGTRTHFGLDGMTASSPSSLKGIFSGKEAQQRFCMKTKEDDSVFQWPIGNFCFYRKGYDCPLDQKGFYSNNHIKFEDKWYRNRTLKNSRSGELPEGEYSKFFTRMELCCTYSGLYDEPMSLPNQEPFILIKRGDQCQQVEGMNVNEEFYGYAYDMKADIKGPKIKDDTDIKRVDIYICVYRPVDIACGEVVTLTDANPQHTFETFVQNRGDKQCTWLFKGPNENGNLVMWFDQFEIDCKDKLEVRFAKMGHTGVTYCGEHPNHPIYSIEDKMMVQLKTGARSTSYLKATVKWVPNSDLCYDVSDKGASYEGKVNITHNMVACLPWTDVTGCPFHAFQEVQSAAGLQENYCRNPDDTFMPWCYTDVNDCRRNYCDVCGVAKSITKHVRPTQNTLTECPQGFHPHDRYCYRFFDQRMTYHEAETTCQRLDALVAMPKTEAENNYFVNATLHELWIGLTDREIENEFVWADGVLLDWSNWEEGEPNNYHNQDCISLRHRNQWHDMRCDFKHRFFCQTLRGGGSSKEVVKKVSGIHCSAPATPDGILQGQAKSSYNVGETVSFKCKSLARKVISRTCLTSGEWSPPNRACTACPQGSKLDGNQCFYLVDKLASHSDAKKECVKLGAVLAMPKTEAINNELARGLKEDVWIGLTDHVSEGHFTWNDGTPLGWKNWLKGQPSNYGNQDCAVLRLDRKWDDYYCSSKRKFFCQTPVDDSVECIDYLPWCFGLYLTSPDRCVEQISFAKLHCRRTCGYCNSSPVGAYSTGSLLGAQVLHSDKIFHCL